MGVSRVELVVLGLLAEGPLHGYDLLERLRERRMELWADVGRASVYQALRRLEGRGLARGRDRPGVEGPERRVYRLTRAGRQRLRIGILEHVAAPGPYETPASAALGLLHLLPPAEARRGLAARERALRDLLVTVQAEGRRVGARPGGPTARRMLDLQAALAAAELAWLAAFRRALGR